MMSEEKIKFKRFNRRLPTVRRAQSRSAQSRMYKGHDVIILVPTHEVAGSRANRSV